MKTIRDYKNEIRELLEYDGDRTISEWEIEFLNTLYDRLDNTDSGISEKQRDKVEDIWMRIFLDPDPR